MAHSPLSIANTFVSLHGEEEPLSHMKLQKLVFYAYGWWLAYNDNPLATEGPEVWKFGPVFSSLYGTLAPFGMKPIVEPQRAVPVGRPPVLPPEATQEYDLLDWVWGRYGNYSAGQLSDMTHKPGTPWQQEAAQYDYKVRKHHRISDDRIKAYFKDLAKKLEPVA